MINHLTVFKEIVSNLQAMEVKYDDENLGLVLLCSLSSSFTNFRDTLLYSHDTLTLDEVCEALHAKVDYSAYLEFLSPLSSLHDSLYQGLRNQVLHRAFARGIRDAKRGIRSNATIRDQWPRTKTFVAHGLEEKVPVYQFPIG